jgi:hypothetical protein
MKDVDEFDAVAESTLRRALRLDAAEQPPRLDVAAIAAAAERRTVLEQLLRVTRGFALAGLTIGIEAVVALAAYSRLAELDASGLFAFGLSAIAVVAERLAPLATLTTDPSIATATLAAVVFAILYERTYGRESVSVRAS